MTSKNPQNGTGEAHQPPWSVSAERSVVVGFWLFLATLELLRRVLDPFRPGVISAPEAVASVLEYTLWAALTPLIFRLTQRLPLERGNTWKRLSTHVAIAVGVSMILEFINFAAIVNLLPPRLAENHPPPIRFGGGPLLFRFGFMDEFIIYAAVLAVATARNYFFRLREREHEATRLQAEAIRLQAETSQLNAQLVTARLDALRMQLNPHFLFNTLNAVSSLADRDPEGVQRIVARLSALLRRALESTDRHEVTLSEELAFIRDYLDIQHIRFQGKLAVEEQVDPALLDALVPNLTLQPLVENAIKHGSRDDGTNSLSLGAYLEGGRLVLTVQDDGPGLQTSGASDTGVGLKNTTLRLQALYGSEASLTLQNQASGGLKASVTLPYHTEADVRTAFLS